MTARSILLAALIAFSVPSAPAESLLLDFDLPGLQETTRWLDLSSSNSSLAPAVGSGTLTVQPPGYTAGSGLYSYSGNYAVSFSLDGFDSGVATVIIQLDMGADAPLFTPTLSFNGGSQDIAADFSAITGAATRSTFGDVTYYGLAWQWNLSALSESITSITVTVPIEVHTSVVGAQLDAGDRYVQAVPEPATLALLALGAAGLFWRLRSRPSQKIGARGGT